MLNDKGVTQHKVLKSELGSLFLKERFSNFP